MDEEMWYLQTHNKLREEKEKEKKKELSFEEKFNNDINDLNKYFDDMKKATQKFVIPSIVNQKNKEDHSKEFKTEINKIIRQEIIKVDEDKKKNIDLDLSKLQDRHYCQNRDLLNEMNKENDKENEANKENKTNETALNKLMTVNDSIESLVNGNDDEYIKRKESLTLVEKVKKIFEQVENSFHYNMNIGTLLIENNIKNRKEDLKDENIRKMYEKIKKLNMTYQWEKLFDTEEEVNDTTSDMEISDHILLQYKLYPFSVKKYPINVKPSKHSYYLEKSRINKDGEQSDFDYDEMDELETHFKKLKETYDENLLNEFNFDTSTPMRIHGLKRSENENLGIMNANSSFDILCKFEDPNDLERKKYLDDKLNMNKEAENLYKEITKFIFHNESDFIDYNEADKILTAPNKYYEDENPAIFSIYNGKMIDYEDENEKNLKSKIETPEIIEYKPTVKLLTRKSGKYHIKADSYFRDRENAMDLTPSSKYSSLKYNYGGYIPAYAVKKKNSQKKVETLLTMDEYKNIYLIVIDSLEQQKRSDERYYQGELKKKLMKHDEETQMKHFKDKYKKYKYKSREIAETKEGYWNPEVLDYMYALSRQKIIGNIESESKENEESKESGESKENEESKENGESKDNNTSKANDAFKDIAPSSRSRKKSSWDEEVYDDVEGDGDIPPNPNNSYVNSDDELSDTISKYFTLNDDINKPNTKKSGIYMTLPTMQEAMECIFDRLKMSINEKVDLAIKYGSYEFSMKFIEAISCWNIVSKLIIKREEKLDRIREFESKISNPYRFFKNDESSSPAARFVEELYRKRFVEDLEPLNKRIIELCIEIFKKYGDVVKYEGKPYVKKMKNDYSDIIKYAYREFEKKQNEVPYTLKF
ncbi:hypothetical protein LY90DRAFT_513753 [Neocallimastix californiae]|uniref:Uncharacterized protein n=1 Tax=Neocallimastix californiae TaxID=1754190 RepID=A0A1Y2AVF2_9FUNG|nr:hypothetical protein LY90DRAFT_513753 [Neocallimastix californiae]|eukprot:ORY26539.1 hypothetical protein LY90DRAFT_513753 [Neocallimastix californiae]